jgi:hypothetical protein
MLPRAVSLHVFVAILWSYYFNPEFHRCYKFTESTFHNEIIRCPATRSKSILKHYHLHDACTQYAAASEQQGSETIIANFFLLKIIRINFNCNYYTLDEQLQLATIN